MNAAYFWARVRGRGPWRGMGGAVGDVVVGS